MLAVILISADAEWKVVREYFPDAIIEHSPFGEYFQWSILTHPVIFFQGGWGKISAAASAQYTLSCWHPDLVVNLGTCGGFTGRIPRGALLLVERTLVYDIIEQMGDPQAAIDHYCVNLDLSWLGQSYPQPVLRGLLVSADRDLLKEDIPTLIERYGAIAGDWESGAIAWTAQRNGARCIILRGVSDLVGEDGGEAYDAIEVFHNGTRQVMLSMLQALPKWLEIFIRATTP